MRRNRLDRVGLTKVVKLAGGAALVAATIAITGCIRSSGETWYVHNAAMPDGWPELTPVGEVRIREYPTYRAAVVEDADINGDGMRPMFTELFDHIKASKIAMTAPVDMSFDSEAAGPSQMASMAFLYRTPDDGPAGENGRVNVRDFASQTFASVGVRGSYTVANFQKGLAVLDAWFAANPDAATPAGAPRYLGYNAPFVPAFMRYGEVQVPVEAPE